ncbi:MAG: hypothetical protein J6C00_14330 [Eubacterium sp.]|nr:hypothetical protein [Eubacterium sp.]
MVNSIRDFEEECINRFEKLEDEFLKDPTRLAEYIREITDELHKLGVEMIKESLETMDRMLQESPIRLKNWVVNKVGWDRYPKQQLTKLLLKLYNAYKTFDYLTPMTD